jgi:hypothetical protein
MMRTITNGVGDIETSRWRSRVASRGQPYDFTVNYLNPQSSDRREPGRDQ